MAFMKNKLALSSINCSFLELILLFASCGKAVDMMTVNDGQDNYHYIIVYGYIQMYTYGWAIKYY